jgi:putative flippase GtrA
MKIKQTSIELFLYLIVGALATVVEWGAFYVFDLIFGIHYTFSTALAFVLSTFANWLCGRLILFKKKTKNMATEIFKIYLISVTGLLMNIAIMYVAIEKVAVHDMVSKIIATGIVFIWNFLVRKLWIYKE